jgi:hypothetical protein
MSFKEYLRETIGLPKKLYHLTIWKNIESIKKNGLIPSKSKSSLVGIFLSDDLFTSENYASMYRDEHEFVILTIDGSKLNPNKIVADNYEFPDLVSQMDDDEASKYDLDSWQDSLKVSNQIAYIDIIKPEWIIKYTKYEN